MQAAIQLVIGEKEYTITTFPAFKGLSYLQKLLKIVGPALAEIFASAETGSTAEDFSVEEEALSKAISLLVENLDQGDVAVLVKDMVTGAVTLGGQPISFDQEFSANYGALVSLLGRIIKENYSSFFDGSGFGGLLAILPQPPSKNE